MFIETTAFKKINALSKRIRCIPGGTSASKSISILLYLIGYAQTDSSPTLTSIVSESTPHLKRGVIRDFKNIMQSHKYWNDDRWNATDFIYTFESGSQIEFFPADESGKLRGGRRDRLFINECNHISFEAFEQLEMRTKEFVLLDWNPSEEFWAYTELGAREDVEWLTLTYLDNEALDPRIKASIESRRNRTNWWKVYGLGQLGEVDERVYTGWTILEKVPSDAKLVSRGLDFGFSNDPAACLDIYRLNNGYLLDEVFYQRGMFNSDIAAALKSREYKLTYADSSEPKSIAELKLLGASIVPARKGKDSVRHGIRFIQGETIYVTKTSVNLIKEYRGYLWKTDGNGKVLDEPEDGDDHLLDALRYGLTPLFDNKNQVRRLNQVYTPQSLYGG